MTLFREWAQSWRRSQRRWNPVVLKCSACRSELHRRPHGWAAAVSWAFWIMLCQAAIPSQLAFGWSLLTATCLAIPFNSAARRLYYAWWTRRHPTRCQGRGTVVPSRSEA